MDLMLLLDGSASIYSSAWLQILHFAAQIGLNFTTGHDFMRYGIVQFGTDAKLFMPLLASNATFQQVVGMLPQFQSSTNTFAGMSAVEAEFNQHARPGSFKAMVILTDGEWNTGGDPIAVATRMKKNGTHIFTVAVGDAATANVQSLSSLPLDKYYYNVSNEAFLPLILHKMILSMCRREAPPQQQPWAVVAPASLSSERRRLGRDGDNGGVRTHKKVAALMDFERVLGLPLAAEPFDCGGSGPGRWLLLQNYARNPLRVRTCSLDYNKEVCKGGASGDAGYQQCAPGGDALAFVPANSTVTIRIPMNVTYLVTIFCVDVPGKSVHCLSAPEAPEFYGPAEGKGAFPEGGLVIPPSPGVYCGVDLDCPSGQKCDGGTKAAPICA
jgi:Cys-rich repeat protein